MAAAEVPPKGECVLVLDRAAVARPSEDSVRRHAKTELDGDSVKAAVARVVETTGLPRREVYQLALRLKEER
jgi:16S rRNA (cytidine1402-2'-O)-methyltransferase